MSGGSYVGGYWGPRQETVEGCTERLTRFLVILGAAHPLLGSWFRKGRSRAAALTQPIDLTPGVIRGLLLAGQSRRDFDDKSVIVELGWSVGLWNGNDASVGLGVLCGAYSPAISNSVALQLPDLDEGDGAGLYRPEVARQIMRALVECWEPRWATWSSHPMAEAQQVEWGPVVGWMTYLSSDRRVRADRLPAGVEIEPIGEGVLVTLCREATDVSEQLVLAVRSSLAGALRSIA